MIKKIFAVFMAVLCLCGSFLGAFAADEGTPQPTTSNVLVIKNLNTGIYVDAPTGKSTSYSATGVGAKLMTAMLSYEILKNADIKISAPLCLKGTEIESAVVNDFSLGLSYSKSAKSLTVKDLVTAAVVSSASDACVALAVASVRYQKGIQTDYYNNYDGAIAANTDNPDEGKYSERTLIKEFVQLMNARAAELGCTDTVFTNCTGAHDVNSKTTAEDIAKIAEAFYNSEDLMLIAEQAYYTLSTGSNRLFNKSALVSSNDNLSGYTDIEGTTGIIVGWMGTKGLSPYCVVSVGETDEGVGYIFVCIAKYTETEATKKSGYDTIKEFTPWALNTFSYKLVVSTLNVIKTIPVKSGKDSDRVSIIPKEDIELLIPSSINPDTDIKVEYAWDSEELTAPIAKGQKVGVATVYYNGQVLKTDLVANDSVSESAALSLLDKTKNLLNSEFMKKIYTVALVLFGVYLLISLALFIYRLIRKYIAAGRGD